WVSVEIVNADSVTGHTYKVTFAPLPAPVTLPGGEVATVGWSLVDSTAVPPIVVLQDQANRSDDPDYKVVAGLRVRVAGFQDDTPGLVEGAFLCRPKPDWPMEGNSGLQGPAFGGGLILAKDDVRIA